MTSKAQDSLREVPSTNTVEEPSLSSWLSSGLGTVSASKAPRASPPAPDGAAALSPPGGMLVATDPQPTQDARISSHDLSEEESELGPLEQLEQDVNEPSAPAEGAGSSLSPQLLPVEQLDDEDEDPLILPVTGGAFSLHSPLVRAALGGIAVIVLGLLFGNLFLSDRTSSSVEDEAAAADKQGLLEQQGSVIDLPRPPPAPASAVLEEPDEAAPPEATTAKRRPVAFRGSPPSLGGGRELARVKDEWAGAGGPSVARFPDLPRDVLLRLAREAEAAQPTGALDPDAGVP